MKKKKRLSVLKKGAIAIMSCMMLLPTVAFGAENNSNLCEITAALERTTFGNLTAMDGIGYSRAREFDIGDDIIIEITRLEYFTTIDMVSDTFRVIITERQSGDIIIHHKDFASGIITVTLNDKVIEVLHPDQFPFLEDNTAFGGISGMKLKIVFIVALLVFLIVKIRRNRYDS